MLLIKHVMSSKRVSNVNIGKQKTNNMEFLPGNSQIFFKNRPIFGDISIFEWYHLIVNRGKIHIYA